MSLVEVFTLIGGLALFLLGMDSMGKGLERACGDKMKSILEKLTSNRFVGVIVGVVITAVIQSSSATTVMLVGFVNAGMMTLNQAVWVLMGANIGTTITGQLVALDIGYIAPIFAIIGVVMMLFIKKPMVNEIGKIFCGFGVLFIGMDMMSGSMAGLKEMPEFVNLMTQFSNPILGILAGMVFTAVIQSSSASIGILQALAISGVIKLESAVFVLFGQNIGTCVTALLASLGTNRNAKRTTLIHLMFNLIGTILFTVICLVTPLVSLVEKLTPDKVQQQIANMHTIFNISTTLILLPFGTYLVKLAEKILPDKKTTEESIFSYLNNDMNINVGANAIHLENTRLEINRMYEIAANNIARSFDILLGKEASEKELLKQEDLVDALNEGITKQITQSLAHEGNMAVNEAYSSYLTVTSNVERLSDHAVNLCEHANSLKSKNITLNEEVLAEITNMQEVCAQMLEVANNKNCLGTSESLEEKIDTMTENYRKNMMNRLKIASCTAEGSIIYSAILIDFERIGDHLLNVAEAYSNIKY